MTATKIIVGRVVVAGGEVEMKKNRVVAVTRRNAVITGAARGEAEVIAVVVEAAAVAEEVTTR